MDSLNYVIIAHANNKVIVVVGSDDGGCDGGCRVGGAHIAKLLYYF